MFGSRRSQARLNSLLPPHPKKHNPVGSRRNMLAEGPGIPNHHDGQGRIEKKPAFLEQDDLPKKP